MSAAWCVALTPCGWHVEGSPDDVERAARQHAGELVGGPGHAVNTSATGAGR